MGGFEREQPDMRMPREGVPDVGVNQGEMPGQGETSEVPMPALNDMLENIRKNPDWVPPVPGETEDDEESDDITPRPTVQ